MNMFYIKIDSAQNLEVGQTRWEKAKSLNTKIRGDEAHVIIQP